MADTHAKEKQLEREIAQRVESTMPGVEVLAVELTGRERADRVLNPSPALFQQQGKMTRHNRPPAGAILAFVVVATAAMTASAPAVLR